MTNERIQSIQTLRGVAILLVLARHIMVMEDRFGGGEMLLPEILKVGDSGVDIFFVISGFIMVVISRGRFQRPGALGTFLAKRITRIYPLYWIYSLVILGLFLLAPALVPALQKGRVDLFASFLLLPQFDTPLLGQGWTLMYEVYFYCVFALALLLSEKQLSLFLLGWALLVSVGYNLYFNFPASMDSAALKLATNPLTVEFILGACVALTIGRGWHRGDWLCLIGGGVLLIGGSLFIDPLEIEGLRFFFFGLPALLILFGAVSLENRAALRFPQWLQHVGNASFSIYLSHILVISAIGHLWRSVQQPGLWDNALVILLMAGTALAIGHVSFLILESPLLRIWQAQRPRQASALPESVSIASK